MGRVASKRPRLVGTLVGMAYIVARPGGRYDIRESVHTDRGPRARSLANFAVLTDEVLAKAAGRATRPFDPRAIVRAARRRKVPTRGLRRTRTEQFVIASRRLASELDQAPAPGSAARSGEPGRALIELIGFAEEVARHKRGHPRPDEALGYPVLSRLAGERRADV